MQFSTIEKRQAQEAFARLPQAQRDNMQLSSVRLTNGQFTGSGVLVIDSDNIPGIITAKHNLYINAGVPEPIDWDPTQVADMVVRFLNNLAVGYGPLNNGNPTQTQNLQCTEETCNSDIEFRNGNGSWDYDLMFISFKENLPLVNYIKENDSHRIKYNTDTDRPFYKSNMVNRSVFVAGFGNVLNEQGQQTTLSHPFQVRTSTVASLEEAVMRHQNPDAFNIDVLLVGASNSTSTAEGDSGGPMFTVNSGKVYLLGATLGSNFRPNEMPPDEPIINNASTYLFYQGELF